LGDREKRAPDLCSAPSNYPKTLGPVQMISNFFTFVVQCNKW